MKVFSVATLFLLIFTGITSATAAELPAITISIGTSVATQVNGYLQTPNGGKPGTSSLNRPTLDELNVRDMRFSQFSGHLQWQHASLYLRYQPMTLSGHAQLTQDLVTHGVTFPAGNFVDSNTILDQKQVGGGWRLSFDDERLQVTPQLELATMNFSYRINDSTQSVIRHYAKSALRVGLMVHYQSTACIGFLFQGMTSLPTPSAPQLNDLTAGVEFNLRPEAKTVQPLLFIGISEQRLDYEDGQTLPNHLHINTTPFVTTGMSIRF